MKENVSKTIWNKSKLIHKVKEDWKSEDKKSHKKKSHINNLNNINLFGSLKKDCPNILLLANLLKLRSTINLNIKKLLTTDNYLLNYWGRIFKSYWRISVSRKHLFSSISNFYKSFTWQLCFLGPLMEIIWRINNLLRLFWKFMTKILEKILHQPFLQHLSNSWNKK